MPIFFFFKIYNIFFSSQVAATPGFGGTAYYGGQAPAAPAAAHPGYPAAGGYQAYGGQPGAE